MASRMSAPLLVVAVRNAMQQRQASGLPSARSSPRFLPRVGGIGFVVEHVVDELVGRAEVFAVTRECACCAAAPGEHGRDFGTGFEQAVRSCDR
jgi:hypothetical protein